MQDASRYVQNGRIVGRNLDLGLIDNGGQLCGSDARVEVT